jgi:Na+-driven multidrug efflux pump
MVALGISSEIVLGHELGQNNLEKANKYAFRIINITIFLSAILSFFIYLISFLVPCFYNIDEVIKLNVTKCIQNFGFTFIITALHIVIFFMLRSGGDTLILSVIDGVFIWLIELPLQYLLIKFTTLDLPTIHFIVLLSAIVKVLIGFIFIKNKMWLNNVIRDNSK